MSAISRSQLLGLQLLVLLATSAAATAAPRGTPQRETGGRSSLQPPARPLDEAGSDATASEAGPSSGATAGELPEAVRPAAVGSDLDPAVAPAHADGVPPVEGGSDASSKPWAEGVSLDRQEEARARFRLGNEANRAGRLGQALTHYLAAASAWDHPVVRLAAARTLAALERPLEARAQVAAALRFGAAPLGPSRFQEAERLSARLETEVARVVVVCNVPTARVTMDGLPLFEGPGPYEGVARPGRTVFSAASPGYLTVEQTHTLASGDTSYVHLELVPAIAVSAGSSRPTPTWVPWTIVAAGGAALATAAGLQSAAASAYARYDSSVERCGGAAPGCFPNVALAQQRQRGDSLQTAAALTASAGALTAAAGVVVALFNQPRPVAAGSPGPGVAVSATLTPVASTGFAGVAATLGF